MGKLTRKYVECIEECKWIERGTLCGVCGRKLGFFFDGFWSINSKDRHLIDGVLCGTCHRHFKELIQDKKWVSKEVKKQQQWKKFTSFISIRQKILYKLSVYPIKFTIFATNLNV